MRPLGVARLGLVAMLGLFSNFGTANAVGGGAEGSGNKVVTWALGSTGGGIGRPAGKSCGSWIRVGLNDPDGADNVGRQLDITKFEGGMRWDLYRRNCEGIKQFAWVPRVSADVLWGIAYEELATRILPDPQPGSAPSLAKTYVNLGTWFWTDASAWHEYSATAQIPGLSVTVYAKPTQLSFDPGDVAVRGGSGQAEVRSEPAICAGPGEVWQPSDGDDKPSDCMHTYLHSTSISPDGVWHGTMSITWTVWWTASNGEGGTLDPLTTSTEQDAIVKELQAIIIGGTND
jgi:hypothetical protein